MTFRSEICGGLWGTVRNSFDISTDARKTGLWGTPFPKEMITTTSPRTRLPPCGGLALGHRHPHTESSTPHKGFPLGLNPRSPRRRFPCQPGHLADKKGGARLRRTCQTLDQNLFQRFRWLSGFARRFYTAFLRSAALKAVPSPTERQWASTISRSWSVPTHGQAALPPGEAI